MIVGLLAAAVLVPGCSSKAQRSYRRADSLDHGDNHQLALDEYLRVAEQSPGHPLADNALYRAAFIQREYLDDPAGAAATYERLVNEYADSEFYENALLRLGALYTEEEELKDPKRAILCYQRVLEGSADRPPMCAAALLATARILLEQKDKHAIERCRQLIAEYPEERHYRAEAQLLLGEAMEAFDAKPEDVLKAYEKVVKDFPGSRTADKARVAIGWIAYRVKQAEDAKPKEPPKAPRAVVAGVPGYGKFAARGWVHAEMIDALTAAAKKAGRDVSAEFVAGITGGPFEFFYSTEDRALGARILAENPPQIVAETLGLSRNQMSSDKLENGLARLRQSIDEGCPVLTPYGSAGDWTLVVGYDTEKKEILLLPGGASGARAVSEGEFGKKWQAAFRRPSGLPDNIPWPSPFYEFSFGQSLRQPSIDELTAEAFRRGAKWMREPAAFGVPSGFAAYETLAADLDRHASAAEWADNDAASLAAWAEKPLTSHLSARRCATDFLRQAANLLSGTRQQRAAEAAQEYGEVARLLESLRLVFPRANGLEADDSAVRESAAEQFRSDCVNARTLLQQIVERERAAVSALERAAQ